MIIEDQDQLKAQLGGVQGKMDFKTVMPFVRDADRAFKKVVGCELYEFLKTGQVANSGIDQDELTELKDVASACIAWSAFDLAIPHLKLRMGDLGLMKTSPAQTVAITKWEYADTRDAIRGMIDQSWESFWDRLEDIKPKPWTDSDAYKWRNLYFIRSADELGKFTPITGRNTRLFSQLETFIRRAEEIYIRDLVTSGLFDELKIKWQDSAQTLSPQERMLVEKIQEPLAFLVLHEAYPYLPIKLDENGLREVRKWDGTTNETTAGTHVKNAQRQQLWQDAQLYMGRLRDFLDQHSSPTQFAQYYTAALAEKADNEQEDFTYKSHVIL